MYTINRLNKLTVLAAAVALSVGLAACGGGSSTTTSDGGGMQMPDPAAAEATAIASAIAAAKEAVDGLTGASSDQDVARANAAIAAAHSRITGAQHASAAQTVANAAALDKIRASLTTAQKTIDGYRMKATAAANKVALTKKAAITAEAGATEGVRPFDGTAFNTADDADNSGNNYGVTVKHTGSAVEVTVVDGHGDYDAKNDPKFARAATFGNGQMLVRNDGADREIIVLYTDIEAPTDVRFGASGSGYTLDQDLDTDTSANDSYLVTDAAAAKLGGSRIVNPNPGTITLSQWQSTGDNAKNVYAGTLDGAAGTFRCQESGGCTITTANNDDRTVSRTGALWFTPNAGATVSVPDADYLTWGFWLDTTTKDGAITSYDKVQTFVMSKLSKTESVSSVTGTASYAGDAAGVYVHETKNEDGSLNRATSGRFTADVAMKAYFAATTLRNDNTIEGTISNFDLDGGPENSWKVNVSASFNDSGTLANGVASGMEGNNGSLIGDFHGVGSTTDNTVAPPILIGEFNANFVNGTVAGAYGARKE